MADDKEKNWRGEVRALPIPGVARRDFYMAHIGAAELSRHPLDAALYLPEIVDRTALLAALLMKSADENG